MTIDLATPQNPQNQTPARGWWRAITAAAALTAAVVVVPLALLFLGSRLPIDVSVVAPEALLRPDDGRLLLLALYALGWLGWAAFTGSVLVEIVAIARGVPAPRLPALGPLQRSAAVLVAAASMLASPVAQPMTARAVDAPALVATITPIERPQSIHPQLTPVAHTAEPERDPAHPTIVVERHDTLWSMAAADLGDGTRYPEILELNRGVTQPDGRRLESPSWLYPGWVLTLPADARDVPPVEAADASATRVQVVQPGDTLWRIAESHLGDGSRYPEIFDANAGRTQPDGRALTDPNLIMPGWQLSIPNPMASQNEIGEARDAALPIPGPTLQPAAPEAARLAEAAPDSKTLWPTPAPVEQPNNAEESLVVDVDTHLDDDSQVSPAAGLVALGIGGLALAGLVAELNRRRRHQQNQRQIGERIPIPHAEAATVERAARSLADQPMADLLRDSLRALAESARLTERALPDVSLVRLTADGIRLCVKCGADALSPFRSGDVTDTWDLDVDLLAGSPIGDLDPYPALVTVGSDGDDIVLLNLESVGGLGVTGDDSAAVRQVLQALAADVALTPGPSSLALTGTMPELASVLDPGRIATSVDDDRLERQQATHERNVADAVAATGLSDLRLARLTADNELIAGCLVVVAAGSWAEPPEPWRGVVRIQAGRFGGRAAAHLGLLPEGLARLHPFDVCLRPARLSPPVLVGITGSLHVADQPPVPAPKTKANVDPPPTSSASGPRILLLGRIDIANAAGHCYEPRIARLTELVVYLALNPDATRDEIAEAIWGGRRVEAATRRQLISRTRTWLGADPDGESYLHTTSEHGLDRLRLSPQVSRDWDEFQRLATLGMADREGAGLKHLDAAISLVRGRPFLGIDPRRYAWAEPHIQAMISTILDVITVAANTHLSAGEHRSAHDQALLGLTVEPTFEQLAQVAVQACQELGDHAGSRRIREAYERALNELLDEPELDPNPAH